MRADPNIWALVAGPCLCHAAGTRGVVDLRESWRIDAGAALRGFRVRLSSSSTWFIYGSSILWFSMVFYGFLWLIYG